ncbi:hypothetical protein RCL1_006165 [Eukaryota sp. TZLM3-RCL]
MPQKRSNAQRRRDILKELNRDLPEQVRTALKFELQQLDNIRLVSRIAEAEQTVGRKFQKVRQIELSKVTRLLSKLPENADQTLLSQQLSYIQHYPIGLAYVSILQEPSDEKAKNLRQEVMNFTGQFSVLIKEKEEEAKEFKLQFYSKFLDELSEVVAKNNLKNEKNSKNKNKILNTTFAEKSIKQTPDKSSKQSRKQADQDVDLEEDSVSESEAENDTGDDSEPEVATSRAVKRDLKKEEEEEISKPKTKAKVIKFNEEAEQIIEEPPFEVTDDFLGMGSIINTKNWKQKEVGELKKLALNESYIREEERVRLREQRSERKKTRGSEKDTKRQRR